MGVCPGCLESRKLLSRFLSYSLPYWPLAVTSLSILLIGTFIGLTPPLLLRTLIDDVMKPVADGNLDTVSLPLIGHATPSGALAWLVVLLFILFKFFIFGRE